MSSSSITSSILDLLAENVKEKPNAPVARRETGDIPDALVLCEIMTVCKVCGEEWKHPNIDILGRYGRNHKKLEKWSSLFEQLPREILEITEHSKSCSKCFYGAVLRTSDVEGGG